MKIRFIVPFVLLTVPTVAAAQTTSEQRQIRDEIRAEVGRLITATNFDVMATLPMYVSTSRVASINDAQIIKGFSGLRRQTEAAVPSQGSFFIRAGNVDVTLMGPDHALAFASMTMEYPGRVSMPGSMTLAYERTPQGWKIVHEHYSTGLTQEALAGMANQASAEGSGLLGLLQLLVTGLSGDYAGFGAALLDQLSGEPRRRE